MTSERQIAANRKNALLSTGPKSEEGKAVVSRNAIERSFYKALAEFRQAQQKRESTIEIGFVS